MGLLDINISNEDRPRVDRLIAVLERLTRVIEQVTSQKQLVVRADLEDKPAQGNSVQPGCSAFNVPYVKRDDNSKPSGTGPLGTSLCPDIT